jgi:pimeloyl-ACP methyl ester carboxylesterase
VKFRIDGRAVFAATGGVPLRPDLAALVFLHGASCDRTVWALQARYFAHRAHAVLAPDLPGHGRSEGPPLASVEALADWTIALLDAAKIQRAALVGHSMGALIALAAAARAPERVRALALLAFTWPMAVNADYLALAEANDPKAFALMNEWAVSRQTHIGGNRLPGAWLIGANRQLTERVRPGVLANDLRICQAYADGAKAAGAVRCPATIILGDGDQMAPLRQAEKFARQFAAAKLIILPGCGHWPMGERPDETLAGIATIA